MTIEIASNFMDKKATSLFLHKTKQKKDSKIVKPNVFYSNVNFYC